MSHLQGGRLDAAARLCSQARQMAPKGFDAHWISGVVALKQERFADAAKHLADAHRITPSHAGCSLRLGFALVRLGRHAEAEVALRSALKAAPKDAEAWDTLGFVLRVRGNLGESIAAHRRAVELQPQRSLSWHNLGNALQFAGKPGEALAAQEKAAACDPNSASAHHGRALALQACHRIPEAVKAYGDVLRIAPAHHASRSLRLMALNYLDEIGRGEMFAEHAAFGAAVGAGRPRAFPNNPDPSRRLRVAFLSPDLRTHSVAYFLEPLLTHLGRSRFEVYLYHDHFVEDAVSERLRQKTESWRNFVGLDDGMVEGFIRADQPDILVDLAGHTGMNRLSLFARRLAPVQVSYLGYPNTTGVDSMDYRLVDAITDPAGDSDPLHSESLVRFAPTAWSYAPSAESPDPGSGNAETVTFGSFNNFAKVTDKTLFAWSKILGSVRGSRLRIKNSGLDDPTVTLQIRERLIRADIDPARVDLLGRIEDTREHLAQYQDVDVALDTFPYNGTTTTCEALWMGTPVVTLCGDRHASRVGASLLTAVGHPEWIARSWNDYVCTAVSLGNERREGRVGGTALREDMRASVLMDHPGQADRFAEALLQCWGDWCQKTAIAA
ncbi:MAG TPA: tetratricopeptide repeat protein [Opitutaceae bacterium]|nr:tetratricopeptide repeat protein [Opitutaceae bacterium]